MRLCLFSIHISLLLLTSFAYGAPVKNVILFIGDGMGPQQIRAGRCFKGAPLSFETFPARGDVATHNIAGNVTDSAAAATAMATGVKTPNGAISFAHGAPLPTIVELLAEGKRWTGLVTTAEMTDATPAAFAAHSSDRSRRREIASGLLNVGRPNVLFGGDGRTIFPHDAQEAGYVIACNAEELQLVSQQKCYQPPFIYAGFGAALWYGSIETNNMPIEIEDHDARGRLFPSLRRGKGVPHLTDMTTCALKILEQAPDGFFLMVESANIDTICHAAELFDDGLFTPKAAEALSYEVVELDRAVQGAVEWAKGRNDTLILVTADHETGGLCILEEHGAGKAVSAFWSSPHHDAGDRLSERYHRHTGIRVPIFATGPGSDKFVGEIDNTDIFKKIYELTLSQNAATSPQSALSPSTNSGVKSPN